MQFKKLFLGLTSFSVAIGLPVLDTHSLIPVNVGKVLDVQARGVSAAPINGPGFRSGITYSHYVSLALIIDSSCG